MANKITATEQYIYLNHQPIAKLEQKELYAIHSDHLGTPRLATNGDKHTVWKASYSPFGKASIEQQKITFNLRYMGQYADDETGIHYNYYRDYNPETGRYLTSDPIALKGGVNTYAFVNGNPISSVDPLGLFSTPNSNTASDNLITQLLNFNEIQIADYVNTELKSFDDRQHFYLWAHNQFPRKPIATQTNWFLAASQVNEFTALGGVGFGAGLLDPFDNNTQEYLESAGLELAKHNITTFVTLMNGGFPYDDICTTSNDKFIQGDGEQILFRDRLLVEVEQYKLEEITFDFFNSNSHIDEDIVMKDINDVFNHNGFGGWVAYVIGKKTIKAIIDENFHNKGLTFDIGNIEHRIILGKAMVEENEKQE